LNPRFSIAVRVNSSPSIRNGEMARAPDGLGQSVVVDNRTGAGFGKVFQLDLLQCERFRPGNNCSAIRKE